MVSGLRGLGLLVSGRFPSDKWFEQVEGEGRKEDGWYWN